jgi:ornithine cyclodeaminase/alanine dehydrogenase-like protein (mu-crystallin family)
MTILLTHQDVKDCVDMTGAIEAMESGFLEEGEGHTTLPQRINMKAGKGWLRVGPVALERSGWMGFKAMNLTPGKGVRYQVHLYEIESGALVAIMDAQYLTTLRTGASAAVATRRLARKGPVDVALIGSGNEAQAQLEAMRALGTIRSARIFSPTPANREKLAAQYRELGVDAHAVDSPHAAADGADVVLAAVRSTETVLKGAWLKPGAHVNSVGTARRDQREIDPDTFTRARRIVVDTREGVFGEAGDAVAVRDIIADESVHELAELVAGRVPGREADDEITLFKSVGTGLQDIGLAAAIYRAAVAKGIGTDLGDFPYLK